MGCTKQSISFCLSFMPFMSATAHNVLSRDKFDEFKNSGDAENAQNLDDANDTSVRVDRAGSAVFYAVL